MVSAVEKPAGEGRPHYAALKCPEPLPKLFYGYNNCRCMLCFQWITRKWSVKLSDWRWLSHAETDGSDRICLRLCQNVSQKTQAYNYYTIYETICTHGQGMAKPMQIRLFTISLLRTFAVLFASLHTCNFFAFYSLFLYLWFPNIRKHINPLQHNRLHRIKWCFLIPSILN